MSQPAPALYMKYENIRSLLHPLKAIVFNDKAKICYAVIIASARGLRITVEHGKSAQAVAYLESKGCDQYVMAGNEVEFAVDILAIIRFLETGIFPSSSNSFNAGPIGSASLRFSYDPDQEKPLEIHLECPTFATRLAMKTIGHWDLQMEDVLDQTTSSFLAKVILKCDALKEAFVDLDLSSEFLSLSTSSDPAYLRFSTSSRLSSSLVDFNAGSATGNNVIVQYFHCRESATFKYRMSLFRASLRAMVFGRRVSLRVRSDGILALQFQMPSMSSGMDDEFDENCFTYVDYIFRAIEDESLLH